MLQAHEEQLKEVQAVPATLAELEATKATLKVPPSASRPCLCQRGGATGSRAETLPSLTPTEAPGPG